MRPKDGAVPIGLGVGIDGALGPLQATVDNVGLNLSFTFPGHGGNLGPLDLALGFRPPNGVGLSIDLAVVTGGGFLSIDTDRGRYAGILQLTLAGFLSVTAIGLIDTKLPDGSDGFSLLILITADFGPGIQLGFGFTLLAVGGLLGLNRGMNFQAIMDGVRTNAITSVMFPTDVIANATRIISDLRAFFPPQPGTFLIGPMAEDRLGRADARQHLARRHHRDPARRHRHTRRDPPGACRPTTSPSWCYRSTSPARSRSTSSASISSRHCSTRTSCSSPSMARWGC